MYRVKQQNIEERPLTDQVKSSSARNFVMGVQSVLPLPVITCDPNPYVNVQPALTEGKRREQTVRRLTFITSSNRLRRSLCSDTGIECV